MTVNKSKFDGVLIDDKIEGVGEGRKIACPPAASKIITADDLWRRSACAPMAQVI